MSYTTKINYLLEIIEIQTNNNISLGIKHLVSATDSLYKLTQALFDNKIKPKYHLRELEGKIFRFGLTNHSIIKLINGNNFDLLNNKVLIPDIFALNSITRMQIESYIIMFYLFFDDVPSSEKDVRYDIYKIHALQKQLNFKVKNTSELTSKKRGIIEKELDETINHLRSSLKYESTTEKEQKKLLKPSFAKLIDSKILFEKSGLTGSGINKMWQLFSNHAHSEYISDRQYNTVYQIKKSFKEEQSLVLTINLLLCSKLVLELSNLFECSKQVLDSLDEKEKGIIYSWGNLGKDKNDC